MDKRAVHKARTYQMSVDVPSLGALPLPYGYGMVYTPETGDFDDLEDLVDYCNYVSMVFKHVDFDEFEEVECDDDCRAWAFKSTDEAIINNYTDEMDGLGPADDANLEEIFRVAVMNEYREHPRRYSSFSLDGLLEYWAPRYIVMNGVFDVPPEGQVTEPRVKLTEDEEEEPDE